MQPTEEDNEDYDDEQQHKESSSATTTTATTMTTAATLAFTAEMPSSQLDSLFGAEAMVMMMNQSTPAITVDAAAMQATAFQVNNNDDDDDDDDDDDKDKYTTYYKMIATHEHGNVEDGIDDDDDDEDEGEMEDDDDDGHSMSAQHQQEKLYDVDHLLAITAKQRTAVKLLSKTKKRTAKRTPSLIKSPNAPKRFTSAFIHFSANMHREIRAQLGNKSGKERTSTISKLVGDAWKRLTPEEREPWETIAREDRARYDREKQLYAGPWKVPKTRKVKDANAPKKPMSAFFAFAAERRAGMAGSNNGVISKALAVMWKEAPEELRQRYIDDEKKKRVEYLAAVKEYQKQNNVKERKIKEAERQQAQIKMPLASELFQSKTSNDSKMKNDHSRGDEVEESAAANRISNPTVTQCQNADNNDIGIFDSDEADDEDDDEDNDDNAEDITNQRLLATTKTTTDGQGIGNFHLQPPSWTAQLGYDDVRYTDEQQELKETFFYPEYLRDAIRRALPQYEALQTERSRQSAALS